jgi:hypothetical protein
MRSRLAKENRCDFLAFQESDASWEVAWMFSEAGAAACAGNSDLKILF